MCWRGNPTHKRDPIYAGVSRDTLPLAARCFYGPSFNRRLRMVHQQNEYNFVCFAFTRNPPLLAIWLQEQRFFSKFSCTRPSTTWCCCSSDKLLLDLWISICSESTARVVLTRQFQVETNCWLCRNNIYSCLNLRSCWPCIVVYQYSKTNEMHFWFNLLWINGLYVFRTLLDNLWEALHNNIWYTASVVCWLLPGLDFHYNTGSSQLI
jgi:hypothetical protein